MTTLSSDIAPTPIKPITDNMFSYLRECYYEESGEAMQRLGKIGRFGGDEVQPEQPHDNAQRFMGEFADLIAVYEMMAEAGRVPALDRELVDSKKLRMRKWMVHSQGRGRLVLPDIQPYVTPVQLIQFRGELVLSGHTKLDPTQVCLNS